MLFLLLTNLVSLIIDFLLIHYIGIKWYFHLPLFIGVLFLVILVVVLVVYFYGLITVNKKENVKPKGFFRFIVHMLCRYITTLFNLKIKGIGLEELEGKKYLLVSNHQSMMDPITIISSMKRCGLTFIMRENITNIPIIGRALVFCGFLPINRENNREGLKTIVKAIHRVEAGVPVGIFPEGTRSKGPNIGPFHDGSFKIAQKACSDIAVIVIDDEYKIHKRFPLKTKVYVKFCGLLKYEEIKDLRTNEIDDMVLRLMNDGLKELREKEKDD